MKIFDIHVFFGKSLFAQNFLEDALKERLKKFPDLHVALIPIKPFDYLYPAANKNLLEFIKTQEHCSPILRVDPWRKEEALALIKNSLAKVLFIHPFEEQIYPTHPSIKLIIQEAQNKKMVVMLACGYLPFSHSAQVLPLIQEFSNVTFILTHGAQINISGMHMEEAFDIFQKCSNALFETSGIYREDYIEQAIEKLGAKRVIFGSATPYYHFPYELKRIQYLKCNDKIKQQISYENASQLFGL